MVKDTGRTSFANREDAIKYFSEIFEGLPPQVIETLIDYTIRNPDKMPPNHSSIDITKEPTIKEPKEVIIEGAVEIYDSPDDPRLSIIKHREGISLVDKEEADILQEKINDALKLQKESDVKEENLLWTARNKKLLKDKILQKKLQRS
jgi:hypothetical protein